MTDQPKEEKSVLTEADYDRLIEIMHSRPVHVCRFPGIDPEALAESVEFYRNLNKFFSESKSTIWKVFLSTSVGALMVIIALGIYASIKEKIGQ